MKTNLKTVVSLCLMLLLSISGILAQTEEATLLKDQTKDQIKDQIKLKLQDGSCQEETTVLKDADLTADQIQAKDQDRDQLRDGSCQDGTTEPCDGTPDQDRDRLKLQDGSCKESTEVPVEQQSLLKQNISVGKEYKNSFRATFTPEQLAILENENLSSTEKSAALKASYTVQQKELLQAYQQIREEQKLLSTPNISERQ
ncbi:MAG: hypothetical protein WAO52_07430, partial [Prolixibacteraceae bacterium]